MTPARLALCGERFHVTYRLAGNATDARSKAEDICVEQTIEFPVELAPAGDIRDHIVGHIESLDKIDDGHHAAVISYAVETSGFELTQLLNVIFGNSSIKPGIRVQHLALPSHLLNAFAGPRFGRNGLRALLHAPQRPLLCTALKPMGLSAEALADNAYRLALGGIDLIKDDHGLANQPFAPFAERVPRCAEAVARANRETGGQARYLPNITAPADHVLANAYFARQVGAGGVLIAPALTGWDSMRLLADDANFGLPILSHPAFQGSFVTSPDNGISHYALFGQIARLAGADAAIFPNYGGRFAFSQAACQEIVEGCRDPMGHIKPIFPAPGGGMDLDRIADMRQSYGRDVVFLIGGALHRRGPDLVENARQFRRLAEEFET